MFVHFHFKLLLFTGVFYSMTCAVRVAVLAAALVLSVAAGTGLTKRFGRV